MNKDKRIFSVHSQKGGVGKTSIALALAGLEAILLERKAIIIDADLTGTSVGDIFEDDSSQDNFNAGYLNKILLANPIEFTNLKLGTFNRSYIKDFQHISYIASSPCFRDCSEIVPLISQEDHLKFFKYRLEKVSEILFEKFDSIIIDLPPGLFGISKSLTTPFMNENLEKKIKVLQMQILVTTSDPNDYLALIPSYSELLCNSKKNMENLNARLVVNKAYVENGRFDNALVLKNIVETIEKMSKKEKNGDRIFLDNLRKIDKCIWDMLIEKGVKETGAIAAEFSDKFRMREIFPAIESLKNNKDVNGEKITSEPMKNWVKYIKKLIP